MQKRIWVRFTSEGFHHWPDAPERRSYLAVRHRHLFGVKVSCKVEHDDRDIEFHDLRDAAKGFFEVFSEKGAQSCEAMAEDLAQKLKARFGRAFEVEVNEDGECGAVVSD